MDFGEEILRVVLEPLHPIEGVCQQALEPAEATLTTNTDKYLFF